MRPLHSLLIAPLWLTLSGAAALPASPLDALFECRMPREQAFAALATLTRETSPDNGPEQVIYVVPADLRTFGGKPVVIVSFHGVENDPENFGTLSIIEGKQAEIAGRVLAANHLSTCYKQVDEPASCIVFSNHANGWETTMVVQDVGNGGVGIGCHYFHDKPKA
jgi:hypothetical protein